MQKFELLKNFSIYRIYYSHYQQTLNPIAFVQIYNLGACLKYTQCQYKQIFGRYFGSNRKKEKHKVQKILFSYILLKLLT